jgi:hypothetical protein
MALPAELRQKMTLTGFILLVLGLITLVPEIYMSGIIVLVISASLQIKDMEAMRLEEQLPGEAVPNQSTYHAW